MIAIAQRATPHVGIFWVVQTPDGEMRLLAAGCSLDQAEPYGDYEDWPRRFILYADRKLLTPAMIAHIETQFHLPQD